MRRLPPTPPNRRAFKEAGFTLMELVIGASLMALILTGAYLCLHASFAAQKTLEPRVDAAQTARVVLDMISAELRAACGLSTEFEFLGADQTLQGADADTLDFATRHVAPGRPGQGDYCQISYYLRPQTNSGNFALWRRRNPRIGLDPREGGAREIIAHDVRGLNLEYYDGLDWHDDWGEADELERARNESSYRIKPNASGFPEAVRITLRMDAQPSRPRADPAGGGASSSRREPPLVFQTVARLNLAHRPAPAAASASSDGGENSASPAPGSAPPGGF